MGDQTSVRSSSLHARLEEDDDEFRSCCGEESDSENEGESKEGGCAGLKVNEEGLIDESAATMYFKGVSIEGMNESFCGFTGIGVVIGRPGVNNSAIQVQKKLDFYVEGYVADCLALIDGLSEAVLSGVKRVVAFTDSIILYDQILLKEESFENTLLDAFRRRIFELINSLEAFDLKLVSSCKVKSSLHLAMVAIGVVSFPNRGDTLVAAENCSICCKDRPSAMMISFKCSHKFCSHCMKTYVDEKLQTSQELIRCPQQRCKYLLSAADCKAFLPVVLYDSYEKVTFEARNSAKICCPYPDCLSLFYRYASTQAGSSSQLHGSCVECPDCQKFICIDCRVPWHTSLNCEEYQNLPLDQRDAMDITFAQDRQWRHCPQCSRMIELTQGCYHITCGCTHEFCYSCGAEYRDGQQGCQCPNWDEAANPEELAFPAAALQVTEQWPLDSFDLFPMILDAYSDQERSQLALIQRFLSGGLGLSDHHLPCQSPPPCPDSYVDAMKDLHQLPWLERFVSVISDNYYDDYIY
ncbi:hypothetical protein V2J09_016216 [Rumex salicifolius]